MLFACWFGDPSRRPDRCTRPGAARRRSETGWFPVSPAGTVIDSPEYLDPRLRRTSAGLRLRWVRVSAVEGLEASLESRHHEPRRSSGKDCRWNGFHWSDKEGCEEDRCQVTAAMHRRRPRGVVQVPNQITGASQGDPLRPGRQYLPGNTRPTRVGEGFGHDQDHDGCSPSPVPRACLPGEQDVLGVGAKPGRGRANSYRQSASTRRRHPEASLALDQWGRESANRHDQEGDRPTASATLRLLRRSYRVRGNPGMVNACVWSPPQSPSA